MYSMDGRLFDQFRNLVYEKSGIQLRDGKEALVLGRIQRRLRELNLDGPDAYLSMLRKDQDGDELVRFLDVITTNHTSFFREAEHFKVLADDARAHVASRPYRVWCAASSTGEEPYTIAMTLADAFGARGVEWKLLATDLSTRVLETAKAARYSEAAIASVPKEYQRRYLRKIDAGFEISPELRKHVGFGRLNLATPPFPLRDGIDVILCRNVMIYFDQPVRERLVTELVRLLRPGGLLIIGHSETLHGIHVPVRTQRAAVYRKLERSEAPCRS